MGRRGGRFQASAVALVLVLPPTVASSCARQQRPSDSTLGFRAGGGLFRGDRFVAMEEWLGKEASYTVQFTGRQTQRDMNGSAFGLLAGPTATLADFSDRVDLSLTIPLGFGRANARSPEGREEIRQNLVAVANGDFDGAYRRVGARLIDAGFTDAVLRLGHESNGAWAPWSSQTNEKEFIAAWRHVHDVMAAESADFRFDWTAIRPAWEQWGRDAYPGDDYVDIVGLDVYWRAQGGDDRWDPEAWRRDYESILSDHLAFAMSRDKPVSYPEWGIAGADLPQFIEAMHEWMADLPRNGPGSLVYHAYFDGNKEFDLDLYPSARDRFRDLFGDA